MVIDGKASLSIKSLDAPAARVTEILGIEPTNCGEKGELFGRARANAAGKMVRRKRSYSSWVLDAPAPDPDDVTGFSSVENLVAILQEKAHLLEQLKDNYYIEIWWSGFSDSMQAGFLLPSEMLTALGALGCDFHGTVYLEEPGAGKATAEQERELPPEVAGAAAEPTKAAPNTAEPAKAAPAAEAKKAQSPAEPKKAAPTKKADQQAAEQSAAADEPEVDVEPQLTPTAEPAPDPA